MDQICLLTSTCEHFIPMNKEQRIQAHFDSATATMQATRNALSAAIVEAADAISSALDNGNKLLICGNGGSASDALHFSGDRSVRPSRQIHRFITPHQVYPPPLVGRGSAPKAPRKFWDILTRFWSIFFIKSMILKVKTAKFFIAFLETFSLEV